MSVPRLPKKLAMTLFYLLDFQREKRYPPTISEIALHFGVSYGAAQGWALTLEKKITLRFCEMSAVASVGSM